MKDLNENYIISDSDLVKIFNDSLESAVLGAYEECYYYGHIKDKIMGKAIKEFLMKKYNCTEDQLEIMAQEFRDKQEPLSINDLISKLLITEEHKNVLRRYIKPNTKFTLVHDTKFVFRGRLKSIKFKLKRINFRSLRRVKNGK